jgi:TIR domain-containing protein
MARPWHAVDPLQHSAFVRPDRAKEPPLSDRAPTLFISHVSEEADLAILLKQALLKDFPGIEEIFVSSDMASIYAGKEWLDAIQGAIERASVLLVLCSNASARPPWVYFEVGAAWIRKIPIIPVCHTRFGPADLPPPLNSLEAVQAGESQGLERLYLAISRYASRPLPSVDFPAIAGQVTQFEERYERALYHETLQFEYHIDVVLPGKLTGERIPAATVVESDEKTLKLFGLLPQATRMWGELEAAARANPDSRWVDQLHNCVCRASNGADFPPVQAIFHTAAGSFQPEVARVQIQPDGSRRVHVHFVNTVVPPLYEVPSDIGILATLLRLALRFRYEVIEKYHRNVESASSVDHSAGDERNLLTQLRASISTIECDAQSRGAQNITREAVVALFDEHRDRKQMHDLLTGWEQTRVRLFDDSPDPTLCELCELLNEMHTANRRFMLLATRQFQKLMNQSFGRTPTLPPKCAIKAVRRRKARNGLEAAQVSAGSR